MSWITRKIRMVAARASDALAQAADIVAPTLYELPVDEFHHRWQTVARFLDSVMARDVDATEQRRLLLESHTRDSLQKLVLLIYAEENASDRLELKTTTAAGGFQHAGSSGDSDAGQLGPRECLEYLLERQIIPHLCDVGKRDQPCGIMSLAMQFVGALLSRVNYPILPTREVHVSVVSLIEAATKKEVEDPVVRKCLINLLNILWKKLRADPVQTEFFFLHADRLNIRRAEVHPTAFALQSPRQNSGVSELVLFTGLLPHMYGVGKIGEKCREALVIAAGVHEKALCRFILQLTPFCHYAVNGVISAYDALPKTLPNVTPGAPSSLIQRIGLESELNFLAIRLRFCCTLAMVARYELVEKNEETGEETRHSIADELLHQFRTRFLEGPLLEGLLNTSEAAARTATLYARIVLEELTACCRDTTANPLLLMYIQFLLQKNEGDPPQKAPFPATLAANDILPPPEETSAIQVLPTELLHRMNSLSSSLTIAAIDLFTYLLDLEDEFTDNLLLGGLEDADANNRQNSAPGAIGVSPRSSTNGAIWFASRFPNSAVAANAHLWKIQGFDGMMSGADIPAADDSEDQVVSLLSYIADAEYSACQRAPASIDSSDDESDDDRSDEFASTPVTEAPATSSPVKSLLSPGGTSRTAAARNAVKPLKEVYLSISLPSYSPALSGSQLRRLTQITSSEVQAKKQSVSDSATTSELPVFVGIVFNRVERILENSFQENLALSGLVSALAQKPRCASIVFDISESRPNGQTLRSILEDVYADALRRISRLGNGQQRLEEMRKKLVEDDNEASLNDHEPETRLLCGYVVLEELLKELCSLLFAKERVKSLPLKPEGYYLEAKRSFTSMPRARGTSEALYSDTESTGSLFSPTSQSTMESADNGETSSSSKPANISKEFEQLLAEAESSIESILISDRTRSASPTPISPTAVTD